MSFARHNVPGSPAGVALATTPEGLTAIHQPECAAAIWNRTPTPAFQSWVDGIPFAQLPRARIILRPGSVRSAMAVVLAAVGLPETPERAVFEDDVAALAALFATVMDTPYVRLRLDVVTTNACRKFHVDAVTCRMVCTYRGTGTQYGFPEDGADPQQILTVATGAPIMLRGSLWPADKASALVHRSPPIEGSGETRLVLVLDPIADLVAEAGDQSVH